MPRLMTDRRKALVLGLANGASVPEASKAAGMSKQAGYEALATLRQQYDGIMDAAGMTPEALFRRIAAKLDATKLELAKDGGQFTDVMEVGDQGTQMAALQLAVRLRGLEPVEERQGPTVNVGVMWPGAIPAWWPEGAQSAPVTAETAPTGQAAHVQRQLRRAPADLASAAAPTPTHGEGTGIGGRRLAEDMREDMREDMEDMRAQDMRDAAAAAPAAATVAAAPHAAAAAPPPGRRKTVPVAATVAKDTP